jgi:Tfp pilus assembly protein PilO
MNKIVLPFTLFVIAVGLFFSYTKPALDAVEALKVQEDRIKNVLTSSQKLEDQRSLLVGRLAGISKVERERLENMILPDTIDVVRFIIHLDMLAGRSGLMVRSFSFPKVAESKTTSSSEMSVAEALFTIDTIGKYEQFKTFVQNIEKSAVLTDITSVRVDVPPDIVGTGEKTVPQARDSQVYTVGLKTYWLP